MFAIRFSRGGPGGNIPIVSPVIESITYQLCANKAFPKMWPGLANKQGGYGHFAPPHSRFSKLQTSPPLARS